MIFTFLRHGSENVFSTLFRCFHVYTTPEQGRKHVFKAAMKESKTT